MSPTASLCKELHGPAGTGTEKKNGISGNCFVDRVLSLLLFHNSGNVSTSDLICWYLVSVFVFHVFQERTAHNTACVSAELEAFYHAQFMSV
jgi:hypothetical protein